MDVRDFVQRFYGFWWDRDLDSIAASLTYPFVIYTSGGVTVIPDADSYLLAMGPWLEHVDASGLVHSELEILEVETFDDLRFLIRAQHHAMKSDGAYVSTSLLRYYAVRLPSAEWRLEMMEYLEMAVPASDPGRVVN